MINRLSDIRAALGEAEWTQLEKRSKNIQKTENDFLVKSDEVFNKIADQVASELSDGKPFKVEDHLDRIEELLIEHMFVTMADAFEDVKKKPEHRLAEAPKPKVPKTLKEVMRSWDLWRKKKSAAPITKRQRELFNRIKTEYKAKLQEFYIGNRDAIQAGTIKRTEIAEKVKEVTKAPVARVQTIIRTETTTYDNQVRRQFYDSNDAIVGYLFLAIRDHATTPWCRSRHGKVFLKGTRLLDINTPPCFIGNSLVLTLDGWKEIACIGTADYVWTHEQRWRKVEEVHITYKRSVDLFQIGSALATSNHPYFERGIGFVQAQHFRSEKGLCASSINLRSLLKAAMGSLVQERSKILLKSLQLFASSKISKWSWSSKLERWKEKTEVWLHGYKYAKPSEIQFPRIRSGAHSCCGEDDRQIINYSGDRSPHQRDQDRQSSRELTGDDESGSQSVTPFVILKKQKVYNLEVAEDNTYYCGGYLVHNCHWNCRSEIVPLSKYNPAHMKLLKDLSRQPIGLVPLPKEWRR